MSTIDLDKVKIVIVGINELKDAYEDTNPTHFISIINPKSTDWYLQEGNDTSPAVFEESDAKKLQFVFWDTVNEKDPECAKEEDIQKLIVFGKELKEYLDTGRECRLLVHCTAGISRSTTATYIVLSSAAAPSQIKDIERSIIRARPIAHQNGLMIRLANRLLEKEEKRLGHFSRYKR